MLIACTWETAGIDNQPTLKSVIRTRETGSATRHRAAGFDPVAAEWTETHKAPSFPKMAVFRDPDDQTTAQICFKFRQAVFILLVFQRVPRPIDWKDPPPIPTLRTLRAPLIGLRQELLV
ncbi:MAG: hypothetical protein R3C59_00590 [Planctomycetaceae bacterium]